MIVTMLVQAGAEVVNGAELFNARPSKKPVRKSFFQGLAEVNDTQDEAGETKSGIVQIFDDKEPNPVMVHAVAVGLQSQPIQVEQLGIDLLLHFWDVSPESMEAILDALFVRRVIRYRSDAGRREVEERRTAVLLKNERTASTLTRFPHFVPSTFSFKEINTLVQHGEPPDEIMMKFINDLTPQKDTQSNHFCLEDLLGAEYQHTPILVYECLVPGIQDDLRFVKIIANSNPFSDIFENTHVQAMIVYAWDGTRKYAILEGCVHLVLLCFFGFLSIQMNSQTLNDFPVDAREEIPWAAALCVPFWIFELVEEFFSVHGLCRIWLGN
jgi:hypothetical protein